MNNILRSPRVLWLILVIVLALIWQIPSYGQYLLINFFDENKFQASISLFLFLLVTLWKFPQWKASQVQHLAVSKWNQQLTAKDIETIENEERKTLTQILGGTVLLISLYFTWQNQENAQKNATENIKIAAQNLKVSEESKTSERFSQAISHLGNAELAFQLGGIYALEQIAKEAPQKYHTPVMAILTAYVRKEASRKLDPSNLSTPPKPQIQAILDVLCRRTPQQGEGVLDLRDTFLAGARFQGEGSPAVLEHVMLAGAVLDKAILSDANLRKADFTTASLWETNLIGASLHGAKFNKANLQSAKLNKAHLVGAFLSGAKLQKAKLYDTDLSGAEMIRTHLENTDLRNVQHLGQDQIDSACIDGKTQPPPDLTKKLPLDKIQQDACARGAS